MTVVLIEFVPPNAESIDYRGTDIITHITDDGLSIATKKGWVLPRSRWLGEEEPARGDDIKVRIHDRWGPFSMPASMEDEVDEKYLRDKGFSPTSPLPRQTPPDGEQEAATPAPAPAPVLTEEQRLVREFAEVQAAHVRCRLELKRLEEEEKKLYERGTSMMLDVSRLGTDAGRTRVFDLGDSILVVDSAGKVEMYPKE